MAVVLDSFSKNPTPDASNTIISVLAIALPFALAVIYLAYQYIDPFIEAVRVRLGLSDKNGGNRGDEQAAESKRASINAVVGQAIVEALKNKDAEEIGMDDRTHGEATTGNVVGTGAATTGDVNDDGKTRNVKNEVVAELQKMVAEKKKNLAKLVASQNAEADKGMNDMKNSETTETNGNATGNANGKAIAEINGTNKHGKTSPNITQTDSMSARSTEAVPNSNGETETKNQ